MTDKSILEQALQKHAREKDVTREQLPKRYSRQRKVYGVPLTDAPVRVSPVSRQKLEHHRIVAGNPFDPVNGKFDLLCMQLLQDMDENGWRVLGITAPMPQCGTTTLAVNIALGLAQRVQEQDKVVLIDGNLKNPSIGTYLGIDSVPGLFEHLSGQVPFQATLVDPAVPRLLVVPNGHRIENTAELLATDEARDLTQRLKTSSDIRVAVVDLPPLLPTDDALALLPHLDCLLVTVADGVSTKRQLQESQRLLKRVDVLGFVLNQISRS